MIELQTKCGAYRTYADALEKLLRQLFEARQLLGDRLGLKELNDDVLGRLEARIHRFRRADCDPHFRIALSGGYNVGKTQVINAILGEELLHQDLQEATFVSTHVRKSRDMDRRLTLRYLTEAEVVELLALCKKHAPDAGAAWPTTVQGAGRVSDEQANRLVASLDNERLKHDIVFLFRALRDPDLSIKISKTDVPVEDVITPRDWKAFFRDYVTRSGTRLERYLLNAVLVDLPDFPLGDSVELVDLPGIDADDPWATLVTLRAVKEVDALLMVVNSEKIYGRTEADLLNAIKGWRSGIAERLFVVVNKADCYGNRPPDKVLGTIQQLTDGIERIFPGHQPRLFFTSAAAVVETDDHHAEALAGLESLAATGRPAVDTLLGHAKVRGGIAHLNDELTRFLANQGKDVKLTAIQDEWQRMRSTVATTLEPRAASAKVARDNENSERVANYFKELRNVKQRVAEAVDDLKRHIDSVLERLGPANRDGISRRLEQTAARAGEVSPTAQEARGDALNLSREWWCRKHRQFRDEASADLQSELLADFMQRCQEELRDPLEVLGAIRLPAGAPQGLPPPPGDPGPAIARSLALRVAEALRDPAQVRPYPLPPPGKMFGAFAADLSQCLTQWFSSRAEDLMEATQGFLRLYLEWHLDLLCTQTQECADAMIDRRLPETYPSAFAHLVLTATQQQERERLGRLIELGEALAKIAVNPGAGGAPQA
jgi:signal recognition particle receptor subunit beta